MVVEEGYYRASATIGNVTIHVDRKTKEEAERELNRRLKSLEEAH